MNIEKHSSFFFAFWFLELSVEEEEAKGYNRKKIKNKGWETKRTRGSVPRALSKYKDLRKKTRIKEKLRSSGGLVAKRLRSRERYSSILGTRTMSRGDHSETRAVALPRFCNTRVPCAYIPREKDRERERKSFVQCVTRCSLTLQIILWIRQS